MSPFPSLGYAHKGSVFETPGRTQGRDSAVVCDPALRNPEPCVRFRPELGAQSGWCSGAPLGARFRQGLGLSVGAWSGGCCGIRHPERRVLRVFLRT